MNVIYKLEAFVLKDITIQQLFEIDSCVPIDVRSPGEFEESSIPNAINIPIFTNQERKEVGTLYKEQGSSVAKWRAMEIVSPKLPQILGSIRKIINENKQPVIYCWRGGMRSRSVATFLEFAGIDAVRLDGGYRAYRQYILEQIPLLIPDRAIVLHGMTGSGKTEILVELKKKGFPIIDLEKLAAHRGSLFGSIGFAIDGHNQKTFDSLLFDSLLGLKGSTYFLVEAESKRIGKVGQSDELYEHQLNGINLYIEASMETRVKRIYKEYVEPNDHEEWFNEVIIDKLELLKKRFKNDVLHKTMMEHAFNKEYTEVIRILLEHYYDPRYNFKKNDYKNEFAIIQADDVEMAIKEIERNISQFCNKAQLSS